MVTQLMDGLWHIDCRTFDKPNVYVIDDGDRTLVDAGWPRDEKTVREELDAAGIDLTDIDRVLLTHYDADHIGTLARLTPDLDAPLYIHKEDAPYVAGKRLPSWTARNGVEALHRLYYRHLDLPNLSIRHVEDGDTIGKFRACHTPGHTPGHTVYLHEDLEVAFLGDLAYWIGNRLHLSGRVTSHDHDQVEASVRTVLDRMPEFEYTCPGHGPPVADGHTQLADAIEKTN
ncbi:MBL fold metallo-hydrolase [Natrinema amylolyticum]|uniref:MBL fold metallo-hydrolase n=1 Tax=Natrinema amylolyticum TaxID=2878679 RepID=UPI001CFC1F36|nr:MBL fold metallo-hydrolase [Natrinema amylolyticum]